MCFFLTFIWDILKKDIHIHAKIYRINAEQASRPLSTIYKHAYMKQFKFNNKNMKELFGKITNENKNYIFTGDFSLNLL